LAAFSGAILMGLGAGIAVRDQMAANHRRGRTNPLGLHMSLSAYERGPRPLADARDPAGNRISPRQRSPGTDRDEATGNSSRATEGPRICSGDLR